jgi:hypothetical protein
LVESLEMTKLKTASRREDGLCLLLFTAHDFQPGREQQGQLVARASSFALMPGQSTGLVAARIALAKVIFVAGLAAISARNQRGRFNRELSNSGAHVCLLGGFA